MMEISLTLRVFVALACIAMGVYSVRLITTQKLQLKYSLLWFLLAIVLLIAVIFPKPLFALANLVGFEQPSNFIFFIALAILFAIATMLTVSVSKLSRQCTVLIQDVALLKKQVERLQEEHDDAR